MEVDLWLPAVFRACLVGSFGLTVVLRRIIGAGCTRSEVNGKFLVGSGGSEWRGSVLKTCVTFPQSSMAGLFGFGGGGGAQAQIRYNRQLRLS